MSIKCPITSSWETHQCGINEFGAAEHILHTLPWNSHDLQDVNIEIHTQLKS